LLLVIVDGTKLTTTGTAGWNSGIFSLESFSANGSVSATAASNSEAVVLGNLVGTSANYVKGGIDRVGSGKVNN
jgi:hypothetical protein